jgi:hypothetical protein
MEIRPEQLRGVVQLLENDPASYRAFGPFWWFIKRLLRRFYAQNRALYFLGGSDEPETRRRLAGLYPSESGMFEAALHHYAAKVQYGEVYDGESYWPDDESPYRLVDPDMGPANLVQ